MKKCPSCQKIFDDSMRFCQVDGTPLVEDVPAFDPYATIVAKPPPMPVPAAPPVEVAPVIEVPPVIEEYLTPEPPPVPELPVIEDAPAAPEPDPVIHETAGSRLQVLEQRTEHFRR